MVLGCEGFDQLYEKCKKCLNWELVNVFIGKLLCVIEDDGNVYVQCPDVEGEGWLVGVPLALVPNGGIFMFQPFNPQDMDEGLWYCACGYCHADEQTVVQHETTCDWGLPRILVVDDDVVQDAVKGMEPYHVSSQQQPPWMSRFTTLSKSDPKTCNLTTEGERCKSLPGATDSYSTDADPGSKSCCFACATNGARHVASCYQGRLRGPRDS